MQAGGILADLFKRDGRDKAGRCPMCRVRSAARRMTMELARGMLELPVADYSLDDRLREIGYGVWEGLTLAESEATDPEIYARRLARQMDGGPRRRGDLRRCTGPRAGPGTISSGPTPSRSPMAGPAGP
ncbi:hypothetical protein BRDID11002_75970 [Bradyrhizobium diazoefficiens]